MALNLTQNSKNGIVSCLPCCFGLLDGGCKNGNTLKTHLFTFNVFPDNPNCVSTTRNDNYNSSGLGGDMSGANFNEGYVFSHAGTVTDPNHTIITEIRFNLDQTWSGRSNIDNSGFTDWEPLTRSFSNEIMFRVTGTIAGNEILMHGFCSCDLYHYDAYFVGAYYYTALGKTYYVTVDGLPDCWQSITNSFSFTHTMPPSVEPVTVGKCSGQLPLFYGNYSFDQFVEMNQAAVICNNGWPILLIIYYFKPDAVLTNIDDPLRPAGDTINYNIGLFLSTPPNVMDLSFPMTFDLEPFYFHGRSRVDGDWGPGSLGGSYPTWLSTHPTFVEVVATE